MEGPPKYPLEILPEEMWIMILLKVKEWEDVQSLMKASKQLNGICMQYRHFWLIEKILPILVPTTKPKRYLEMGDLKTLRLVDKRWNRAVAAYLENQPYHRPYNKNDSKVNTEAHIWSDICPAYEMKISEELGSVSIKDYESMRKLTDNFKKKDNPFLSRSLIVYIPDYQGDRIEEQLQTFWNEMDKTVFKRFAKQIWFLKLKWPLSYDGERKPELMLKLIVKSLSSLPNLKGFHIGGEPQDRVALHDISEARYFRKSFQYRFPLLPFLESLKISDFQNFPELFSKQLISKHCEQLRRLHVLTYGWDTKAKWTFPNLTELHLDKCDGKIKVQRVLKSLRAPRLVKLRLTAGDSFSLSLDKDIFPWISRFPSLLYFEISHFFFEVGTEDVQLPQNSKLKYLKIRDTPGVTYDFLRYLPNLQRIQLGIYKDVSIFFRSPNPEVKPELKLDVCALKLNPFNIWENCQKLKTLSVCYMDVGIEYLEFDYDQFDRATYEKLAKGDPKDHVELTLKYLISLFPGFLQIAYDCFYRFGEEIFHH